MGQNRKTSAGLSSLGGLVYSTESGRLCPDCHQPVDDCICQAEDTIVGNGKVRISYETKGRKGKGVTLIKELPLTVSELSTLAKSLKKLCGTGGAVKDGVIEIQGDQRQRLLDALNQQGYQAKLSGG